MNSNIYIMLKEEYPDSVILIKSGYFFMAYNQDAYIINNLFNYKINNEKAYIPSNKINKIISELIKRASIVVVNKAGILSCPSETNDYDKLLQESKNKYLMKEEITEIKNTIKQLIEKDVKNSELIEKFLIENI